MTTWLSKLRKKPVPTKKKKMDNAPATVLSRQQLLLASVFILVVFGLWLFIRDPKPTLTVAEDNHSVSFNSPIDPPDLVINALKAIQAELKQSDEHNQGLIEQITRLRANDEDLTTTVQQNQTAIETLEQQWVTQAEQFDTALSAIDADNALDRQDLPLANNPTVIITPTLHTIDIALTPPFKQNDASATTDNTLPPGSFVPAVMLNGLDADTSVNGQGNPKPVLLRLVGPGNLPNGQFSHLDDCIVVGAGIGDISSERAYIRLDTLSCVNEDGSIIDTPVFGHVVDKSDGKVGVKGQLRMGESRLVRNAFFAGVASGLGRGISAAALPVNGASLGASNVINPTQPLQMGFSQGVGEVSDRMSDYFIRRADQYSPVIEIPPQAVDLIFIKEAVALSPPLADPTENRLTQRTNDITPATLLQAEIAQSNQLLNFQLTDENTL